MLSFSRDGKALERFLQDYFDGNLKRYLKSEPIPENNDGPVKVSKLASSIMSKTFFSVVAIFFIFFPNVQLLIFSEGNYQIENILYPFKLLPITFLSSLY